MLTKHMVVFFSSCVSCCHQFCLNKRWDFRIFTSLNVLPAQKEQSFQLTCYCTIEFPVITDSKMMLQAKMFSCKINMLLQVHWINTPFIIVVSLLLGFFLFFLLQSFRTAGRKSMTPFTAATMSSKSGTSLICNVLLLIFSGAWWCRINHIY